MSRVRIESEGETVPYREMLETGGPGYRIRRLRGRDREDIEDGGDLLPASGLIDPAELARWRRRRRTGR